MPERVRRALLFMPGDDRRKIEKGAGLDVDTVIMDLEDGVALNNKENARKVTREALHDIEFGRTERLVRTNPVMNNNFYMEDIKATVDGYPSGYVLPKIERPEQIKIVSDFLLSMEHQFGWLDGSIRLIAIIESAFGVLNVRDIATSSRRLSAMAFGAEDFAGSIGAIRTPDAWEVFHARSRVVLHARAYGLGAIDTPFVDLTADDSMVIAEAQQAHYMGYTGKFAIHPRHVAPIQQVFTPTQDQIHHAKQLIAAHESHQDAGTGVFEFEGRMVDMPMVRSAETILARARAAGIDVD